MANVEFENVYKSFPARQNKKDKAAQAQLENTKQSSRVSVLRRINLSIEDGEFMVLVGPSGCGKSTLLRLIAGLEELTGGNIRVGDRLINQLPPKARDIAMVFQSYALYPHLTVYNNLAFGLRRMPSKQEGLLEQKDNADAAELAEQITDAVTQSLPRSMQYELEQERQANALRQALLGWADRTLAAATRSLPKPLRHKPEQEQEIEARIRTVAEMLQIDHLLNRLPKELSGGQKQRVALGRAIARNPQVFLMDEPLSNLDAKLRAETRAQIVSLQRQLGTTTIYVTHDQVEAMTMGQRIAVMAEGEIQQVGAPLELYNRPANRFVAGFIGSPPMNFIPVTIQAPALVLHEQFRFTLPDGWPGAVASHDRGELLLGIRPEHLQLGPAATKNLPMRVEQVEALGSETFVVGKLLGTEVTLQARVEADKPVTIGDEVWLSMRLEKLHLFDPATGLAIVPEG